MTRVFTQSMADQIGLAALAFHQKQTGRAPQGTTVVLSGETLVITLSGALSEAERALSRSPDGAAQVQEFHRRLFSGSADALRLEIKKITGVAVGEGAAEVGAVPGAIVHAFAGGAMVQVFLLGEQMSQHN
jgi:uncharacterized protein YbcI